MDVVTPRLHLPIYTLEQFWFNQTLRSRALAPCDVEVGFDLDGYAVARGSRVPHFANIKGVLADAIRFESGMTSATMTWQARCERLHAERADAIVTISQYCSDRIREFYKVTRPIAIVPELIDLADWRARFAALPDLLPGALRGVPPNDRFVVLCVCRFFPRKRVGLLLQAARILRSRIQNLEIRIVGDGPEAANLRHLWRELHLEDCVTWVGDASRNELAREYKRADVFCLPSVQEGFGIVFLEAMAAAKPIVAVRAAAVPEVVPQAMLVEPDNAEALADGIAKLYRDSASRHAIAQQGAQRVEQFDIRRVAPQFLTVLEKLL